jgi:hypothetical protein
MTTEEIESQYRNLGKQMTEAQASIKALADDYELSGEDVFVMPPLDFPAFDRVLQQNDDTETAAQLRAMRQRREEQLSNLPPDVRAAIVKLHEVIEHAVEIQDELVHKLSADGVGVAAIAKRLGIEESTVTDTLAQQPEAE